MRDRNRITSKRFTLVGRPRQSMCGGRSSSVVFSLRGSWLPHVEHLEKSVLWRCISCSSRWASIRAGRVMVEDIVLMVSIESTSISCGVWWYIASPQAQSFFLIVLNDTLGVPRTPNCQKSMGLAMEPALIRDWAAILSRTGWRYLSTYAVNSDALQSVRSKSSA